MAFVRAAVALNNTSLSGISAFFFSKPMLLSGVDYYTEKEGINVGTNTLYIENTSPRLSQIGVIDAPNLFAQKNVQLQYCDFSLFPNLSTLGIQWQNVIQTIDLRFNPNMAGITGFTLTSLTGLFIEGLTLNNADLRDSQIEQLNINNCKIDFINLGQCNLSSIGFIGGTASTGTINHLAIPRAPFKLFDFSECSTRFLSTIRVLNLSPENIFAENSPKLSSFNFTGPLSSLEFLNIENNHLSSISLFNLPTLNSLFLGYSRNKQPFNQFFTGGNRLSSVNLVNLHGLKLLDIGYNPITAVNLDSSLLSALETLKVENTQNFGPGITNINTQLFNLSSQTNLKNLFLNENTNLSEINFLDYPVNFKDTLLNLSAYNCYSLSSVEITPLRSLQKLNLANCVSLSSLNAFSLTALDTLDLTNTRVTQLTAPIIPNNLRNLLIGGITAFNFPTLLNLNQLSLGIGLSAATFTTLSALSSLIITNSSLRNISLEGLSSLQIFNFNNNRTLSSIVTTNLNLPNLKSASISHSFGAGNAASLLSTVCLTGFNALEDVSLLRLPLTYLQIGNNTSLKTLNIFQDLANNPGISQPNLQPTLVFDNLPSLIGFTLNGDPSRPNTVPRELIFTNSPILSVFTLSYYPQLSACNFLSSNTLTRVDVTSVNLPGKTVVNSFPNLEYFSYNSVSANNVSITNTPVLSTLIIYNGILSSFDITNAPELRTLSIGNNRLSSLELKTLGKLLTVDATTNFLRDTNTFNTNLTSVQALGLGSNRLTSLSLSCFNSITNLQAFANNLSAVDFSNNPRIEQLTLQLNDLHGTIDITPITGIKIFNVQNNNLTSVKVSSFNKLDELYVGSNNLTQENIDSLMIQLCAGGNAYLYDYSVNPTGRSSFSNDAYTHLNSVGVFLNPNEPNNTVNQPKPTLTIVSPALPATLAYTQTLALSATAYYIGNSVPTFYSVLSGPGATLSPTVSALSGTGTITVLVSTLSTTVFAPTSALFDITLTKLDISSFIQFSNTGFVYDGNAKSVSAFSVTYPDISYNIFYLSAGSIVTPIETGSYIVSAVSVDGNYSGSASTTMTIYPAGFYILPAGAKSTLIYSSSGFDTRKDVVVTFDYAFYGTETQAGEGFCVSFIGYTPIVSGGAPGYGLNYTNASFLSTNPAGDAGFKNYDGLYSGILGIGFDSTGNFGTSSFGVTGLPTAVPNTITVRGGFYDDYQVITRTASLSSFANPVSIYQQITGSDEPVYRRIRIRLTDLGKKLIVQQKELSAENFFTYLDYNLGDLTPNAIRPCLSYSSGLTAANFKIKNFNINGYFNNNYNEPVEPTTFDTSIQIPISGGPAGSFGVTFTSLYQSDIISYDSKLPTDLPLTMDVYINGTFVATVDFDPVYIGEKFVYFKFNTQTNYEGIFAPGSVQVL